jgi:hypothetical protein
LLIRHLCDKRDRRVALRLQQLVAIADLGNTALHAAYKLSLDRALAIDFDDVELWLIRGNAEEPTAAGRGQRGAVQATGRARFREYASNRIYCARAARVVAWSGPRLDW